MEAELTLDKAKLLIRQWEVVTEQQAVLKTPLKTLEETSLDAVASSAPRRKQPAIPIQATRQASIQTCRRCGRGSHP